MTVDVQRHAPDDDPPWIEVEHDGGRYEFQIVGEDELQFTATGEGDPPADEPPSPESERAHGEPPEVVIDRLESMGYTVR